MSVMVRKGARLPTPASTIDLFVSLLVTLNEQKLEERFRINRRELIPLEFPVLVALEMGLYLPENKVMPHYRRLVQQG